MKHLFYTWKLGCLLLLILAGCSSKKSVSSYHSFESECLGVELDGSETLRAWGRGKNRTDAIEQAKKNAVRDVLFKGVVAGSRECSVRPLITEVNAQERYASYFNDFFRDGGEYLKYVSMEVWKIRKQILTRRLLIKPKFLIPLRCVCFVLNYSRN